MQSQQKPLQADVPSIATLLTQLQLSQAYFASHAHNTSCIELYTAAASNSDKAWRNNETVEDIDITIEYSAFTVCCICVESLWCLMKHTKR